MNDLCIASHFLSVNNYIPKKSCFVRFGFRFRFVFFLDPRVLFIPFPNCCRLFFNRVDRRLTGMIRLLLMPLPCCCCCSLLPTLLKSCPPASFNFLFALLLKSSEFSERDASPINSPPVRTACCATILPASFTHCGVREISPLIPPSILEKIEPNPAPRCP